MASCSSSTNYYSGGTAPFGHNCSEWSRRKLENVLCLVNTSAMVLAIVFLFVATLLSLSLAFVVRCDDGNLISGIQSIETFIEKNYTEIYTTWKTQLKEREENFKAKNLHLVDGAKCTFDEARGKKLHWVPPGQFSSDLVEPSGYENYETHIVPLYIGRTLYENGTIVGKYVKDHEYTYFAYGGIEHRRLECEVMVYPKGTVSWILKEKGSVLPAKDILVYGGVFPTTQETGYICRFKMDGHLVIGMTQANITVCSSPILGFERTTETFEILVINAMGRLLGVDSPS